MASINQFVKHWANPRNWSNLSEGDLEVSDHKKNIFFSQLCVLGPIFTILLSINDFMELNRIMMSIDVCSFVLWPICWWLNENGKHLLAKVIILVYLNILFFVLSGLLDPSVKFELLFYPLIILTFMTLGNKEKWIAILFAVMSFAFLLTLALTDNRPFGIIRIQEPSKTEEILNIFTAAFFTGACAVFIINLHTRVEKSLREKRDELSKANEELDRFVYSASHDMRAPLTSIQGLVELALIENKDTPSSSYLDMIQSRAVKLDDLITDITNYSRNNRIDAQYQLVNLNEIVSEAIEKIRFINGLNPINIKKEIIGDNMVNVDVVRLNILINNLLTNSVKYYDPRKENPEINITIVNNDILKIRIEDNGLGINKIHHEKIFQMFYRATQESEGSGLGLYIVKEVVSKLNGSISFQSEERKGTMFEIQIPHPANSRSTT